MAGLHARLRVLGFAALLFHGASACALFLPAQSRSFDVASPQAGFAIDTTTPGIVDVTNEGVKSASQPLVFDQFDPALGVLHAVMLQLESTVDPRVSLQVVFDGNATVPVRFVANAQTLATLAFPPFGFPRTDKFSDTYFISARCDFDSSPNGCQREASIRPLPEFDAFWIDNLFLAPYIGSGTFVVTASLDTFLDPEVAPSDATGFVDGATLSGQASTRWLGDITLIYEYTPSSTGTAVPEPLMLGLLAAGGVGLGWTRRRRRA